MLAWLVQSFPIHIGYNRQYFLFFTLFEPPLLQYWMLFLEFFCTECTDKFCGDASGFIYGFNLFRGCLGAGQSLSAVEVEGHEVYVSAPEWRLLFFGSGCNNNYVYTERDRARGYNSHTACTDGKYALDAKPKTLSNNKDTKRVS